MKRLAVLMLLGVLLLRAAVQGAAAPAAATSCVPSITRNSTAQGVAAHLSILATSKALGGCPTAVRVAYSGRDGSIYGVDYSGGLWRSSDDLTSWQKVFQLPHAWSYIGQVLELADHHFLLTAIDTSNNWHIVRSTGADATSFDLARHALNFPSGSRIRGDQSWVQVPDGSIYAGEYGSAPQPVHLWRSIDDGVSFQTVSYLHGQYTPTRTCTCVRHIHGVQVDPYQSGRIWVTWGDTGNEPRIGYSDDHAKTFTYIAQGGYYRGGSPLARVVALNFTPDAVYWATDSPEFPAGLFRWDRATHAITRVLSGLNGPFYDTVASNGYLAQFSQVAKRSSDGYIGDEHIHVLTSKNNGADWNTYSLPFVRDQAHADENTYIDGESAPDPSGDFWVSLINVAGSTDPDGIMNVKLHLGDAQPVVSVPQTPKTLAAATLVVTTGRLRLDRRGSLVLPVRCRRQAGHARFCTGILSVRVGRRTIGTAIIRRLREGGAGHVRIHVTRVPAALRASRSVRAQVLFGPRGRARRIATVRLLPRRRR